MVKRIIALNGGIGNQMFQYAFGRMIEKTQGCHIEFDISFYDDNTSRSLEITKYSVGNYVFDRHPVYNKMRRLFQRVPLLAWIVGVYKEYTLYQVDRRVFRFKYRFYFGYWQNKGYFFNLRNELLEAFEYMGPISESEGLLINNMNRNNTIAVHIRRGDYLEGEYRKIYYHLNESYYKKAIVRATIEMKLKDCSEADIYVFSDDIEWCREHLADIPNMVFVDENASSSAHIDMLMMKSARCIITANSTFSWWAAWLSDRTDKLVIVPDKWFVDEQLNERVIKGLIESEWVIEKA